MNISKHSIGFIQLHANFFLVFWSRASQDFPLCDLLLIFGTSLSVAPFNSMVQKPRSGVPRVYINKSKPGSAG